MKCPYCNEEMESGYIQCRDGVYWSNKERAVAAISPFGGDVVTLAKCTGMFSGASIAAYNCRKCKKIVIDYEGVSL